MCCVCVNAYLLSSIFSGLPRNILFLGFPFSMHCSSSRAYYVTSSSSKNTDIVTEIVACLRVPSCLIRNSCVEDIWVEWLFSIITSLFLLRDKENGSGLSSKQVGEEGKCNCSCALKFKCDTTGQEPKESVVCPRQ